MIRSRTAGVTIVAKRSALLAPTTTDASRTFSPSEVKTEKAERSVSPE